MKLLAAFILIIVFSHQAVAQCSVLPSPPTTTNDTVMAPGGPAVLTATGDSVRWYDAAVGGTWIATANALNLPNVTATSVYYASNLSIGGNDLYNGGRLYHSGTLYSLNYNINAKMHFNVADSVKLVSVKVYTDLEGTRVIQLFDSTNAVIASDTVYITPDSMIVDLNFPLAPGSYSLGTDGATNQQIPNNGNTYGPRLRRNSNSVTYPYEIGPNGSPLLTITGNDQGSTATYFYFYDWKIETPLYECESERTPAEVYYDNSIGMSEVAWNDVALFPNPSNGVVYVKTKNGSDNGVLHVSDVTGREVLNVKLSGSQLHTVDASSLSPGVYNATIETNGISRSTKLLIVR